MSMGHGLLARIRSIFGGRAEPLDPARDDLVVVVASFDDAEACSTALERGAGAQPSWTAEDEALLRHHLELPAESVERAIELAGQDGYVAALREPIAGSETVSLVLQRVQVLDALHCAQEKSRMASLAQRLGGTALGWDALQPPRGAD